MADEPEGTEVQPEDPLASLGDEALASHPRLKAMLEAHEQSVTERLSKSSEEDRARREAEHEERVRQAREEGLAEARGQGAYHYFDSLAKEDPERFVKEAHQRPEVAAAYFERQRQQDPQSAQTAMRSVALQAQLAMAYESLRVLPESDRAEVLRRYNQGGYPTTAELYEDITSRRITHGTASASKKAQEELAAEREAGRREALGTQTEGYEGLEGRRVSGRPTPAQYAAASSEQRRKWADEGVEVVL